MNLVDHMNPLNPQNPVDPLDPVDPLSPLNSSDFSHSLLHSPSPGPCAQGVLDPVMIHCPMSRGCAVLIESPAQGYVPPGAFVTRLVLRKTRRGRMQTKKQECTNKRQSSIKRKHHSSTCKRQVIHLNRQYSTKSTRLHYY